MTGDKVVSCGEIRIGKNTYAVFVGHGKKSIKNQCVFLSEKDLDSSWHKKIIDEACVIDPADSYYGCDPETKMFVRLYVLYSIKRYAYFSDLADIVGLERIVNECRGNKAEVFYFDKLCEYLSANNYSFKILVSNRWLYKNGAVPYSLKKCNYRESGCLQFVFWGRKIVSDYAYMKWHSFINRMGRKISGNKIRKELRDKYKTVIPLNFTSESGSAFFQIEDGSRRLFVKAQTPYSDSLKSEWMVSERIESDLAILADRELSAEKRLFFPFVETITLKEVRSKRKLSNAEFQRLCAFFEELLDLLSRNNIVHRDITPANICVIMGQEGAEGFRLMDFGVSVYNKDLSCVRFREHVNRTCGSRYRYSFCCWDDAYSAFQIALEMYPEDGGEQELALLRSLLGKGGIYYLDWSPKSLFS